jgi:hypothetical protein
VNIYDVLSNVFSSTEFITLQDEFACYKVDGYYVTFSSTVGPGMTAVQALTPAFIATNYGHNSSVSASNIARSDAAVEIKVNSLGSQKQTISYGMPPMLIGANGYPIMGSSIWFSTVMPISAGNLTFMLGYLQTPTFTSTASNQYVPVGVLDFHVKIRFAQPILE